MGLFKDMRSISVQAKQLSKTSDPGARLQEMNTKIRALDASLMPPAAPADPPTGDPVSSHQGSGMVSGLVNVVAVEPCATYLNGSPTLTVTVLIMPAGRPPIPSTATVVVPASAAHRVVPGATLRAELSQHDPVAFSIDFTR